MCKTSREPWLRVWVVGRRSNSQPPSARRTRIRKRINKVFRRFTGRFDLIRRGPDLWGKLVRRVQWH